MRELAEYLKSERLKRGLTLEDISRQVTLSKNVLHAMEEGAFEKIGTPLLIRRFIASYCSALGIDSSELLEKHAAEINSINLQRAGIERYSRSQDAFRPKSRKKLLLALISFAVIASAIYWCLLLYENRKSVGSLQSLRTEGYPQQEIPPDLSGKSSLVVQSQLSNEVNSEGTDPSARDGSQERETSMAGTPSGEFPSEQPAPEMDPVNEKNHAGSAQTPPARAVGTAAAAEDARTREERAGNLLSVQATQEAWIQVIIDGTTTESMLMKAGDSREWAAGESVQVVLGNSAGVRMQWNGQPLNLSGRPGAVMRFRLPDARLLNQE